MNVHLLLCIVAESFLFLHEISCYPRWSWTSDSKFNLDDTHPGAHDSGCGPNLQCVQVWKCPETAHPIKPSSSCANKKDGPWVCCCSEDNDNHHSHDDFPRTLSRADPVPELIEKPRKRVKIWNDHDEESKPILHLDNSKEGNAKPSAAGSVGDLPINAWERPNVAGSWNAPTKSTNLNDWRKSTKSNWDGWSMSTSSHNSRTTKHRFTTDSRIVFPTEAPSWTHKTKRTTLSGSTQKTTKYVWKTTEDSISYSSVKPWTRSTTNRLPYSTTKSWTRSTPRPWTHSSSKSWTESTAKAWTQTSSKPWSKSTLKSWTPTTKSWVHSSAKPLTTKSWGKTSRISPTKGQWSSTTKRLGNPNSRVTKLPSDRRSTSVSWAAGDERKNINRGNPKPDSPTSKSTSTTRLRGSTTKRFSPSRPTTPLPNINTYLCGIREEISFPNVDDNIGDFDVDYPGSRNGRGRQAYQRIVGGEEAEPFSWPWVAALYKVSSGGGKRFLSAGSLMNQNFVLTAAHPFTPDDLKSSSYVVMLGTHNAEDAIAEYRVSSVVLHPSYEQRYYYNDIALLRLESPVVFNDFVMPVCLPSSNAPLLRDRDLEGKNVTVMGWGDDSFGGKSSRVLKEASFPIMSRRICNASYVKVASNRFPKGISENMLCAGDPRGGKDACQGDSGGPLMSIERGRYTQVGIVSFGYKCGDKEFPGVYTKVAPYLSWIAEHTKRVQDSNYDYDYVG